MKKNIIYRILRKIYYSFYIAGFIRYIMQKFVFVWVYDQKSMGILLDRIKTARNNNQKIYVQLPICPWSYMLQRPQQMAIEMAKQGYLVIYLSPITAEGYRFVKKINDNIYVTDQYNLLKYLRQAIISEYVTYPRYIDMYLSPSFYRNNHVFCEYVDHVNEQICGKSLARIVNKRLQKLHGKNYHKIVATSQILYDELKDQYRCSNVELIPNGVDVQHYSNLQDLESNLEEMPSALRDAIVEGKTIIGYFGAIAPWIWDEILLELSEQRPDYFLLLLGPVYGDRGDFPQRDNVCCPGAIDYKDLPSYAKYFDVSIIPFRLGDIAKTTSPLKLFEYFAIGKPIVVTSDLVECIQYEGVFVANDAEEFVAKIDDAVAHKDDQELQQLYNKHAIDNSWTNRCHALINSIHDNDK